jgi:Rha family phage regulatory protein
MTTVSVCGHQLTLSLEKARDMATRKRNEFSRLVQDARPRILALLTAKGKMKPVTIRAELNIDEYVCRAALEGMRHDEILATMGRSYHLNSRRTEVSPLDSPISKPPPAPVATEKRLELVRVENGHPITDSRMVAEVFGKDHANVLKAIDNLDCSTGFRDVNFNASYYVDYNGKKQPYVQMTRDGFFFLAMGFTGAEAAQWKEQFIKAFNTLEAAIIKGNVTLEGVMHKLTTLLENQQIAVQNGFGMMNGQIMVVDKKVDTVDGKVDRLGYRTAEVEKTVHVLASRGRRKISDKVKLRHRQAVGLMGGNCPCCGVQKIIVDGVTVDAEDDHFYQNSLADEEHTWLICKPCHKGLTHGKVARGSRESEFKAYQNKMQRLPGFQPAMMF